jgi:peptidoglycan/LPS O-acetylase OafA/YrhL
VCRKNIKLNKIRTGVSITDDVDLGKKAGVNIRVRRFLAPMGRLPCWTDISCRNSSLGRTIPELDTLRGIAALLVLADHTSIITKGAGGNGVWLFFALSGYLLTRPFLDRQEGWTCRSLLLYAGKRLARILPMYWVVVLGYFLAGKSWHWTWLHLLFWRGDLHLWTVQQELLFYLLLPGLLFLVAFLGRSFLLKAGLLYGLAICTGLFLGPDIIRLPAIHRFNHVPFQVAPFLAGMGAAYLSAALPQTLGRRGGKILLLLLLLGLIYACNRLWPVATGSREIWRVGILFSLLLVTVQLPGPSWLKTILGFVPLRAVGIVGYSYYLLHLPLIQVLAPLAPTLGKPLFFLFVGLTAYLLSCLTYSLVEKPCMTKFPAWIVRVTNRFAPSEPGRQNGCEKTRAAAGGPLV